MRVTDKAQEQLDKILESFESGTVPEALATVLLPPLDGIPSNAWSLNNRLLMFLATTGDARGIRQWRDVGRYPRKGSKALYILVPMHGKRTVENDQGEKEERQFLTGFSCCPVFRFEDTDGKDLEVPHVDLDPPEPPPLYDVAESWGIAVDYQPQNGMYAGVYQGIYNRIGLCTHDTKVFFHELAHAAHDLTGLLRTSNKWQKETVAELTAAVLAHLYGDTPDDGGAYRYIRGYADQAGKDIYAACMSVIADVSKCLDLIITQAETLTRQPEPIAAD